MVNKFDNFHHYMKSEMIKYMKYKDKFYQKENQKQKHNITINVKQKFPIGVYSNLGSS